MTLASSIYILDPVNPRALFDVGLELLQRDPNVDWEPYTHELGKGDSAWDRHPGWATNLGQGLSAIFDVTYGADGPLRSWSDEDIIEYEIEPEVWHTHAVAVGLDTGYAYGRGTDYGCCDLHLWLIREMGAWIDQQLIPVPGGDARSPRWFYNLDSWTEHPEGWDEDVAAQFGNADRGDLSRAVHRPIMADPGSRER